MNMWRWIALSVLITILLLIFACSLALFLNPPFIEYSPYATAIYGFSFGGNASYEVVFGPDSWLFRYSFILPWQSPVTTFECYTSLGCQVHVTP